MGAVAGCLYVATVPILAALLSGGRIQVPLLLRLAAGFLILVQSAQLPSGYYLTHERGFRFQAWLTTVMMVVNVVTSTLLSIQLGSAGPYLGSLIAVGLVQLAPTYIAGRRRLLRRGCDYAHQHETVDLGSEELPGSGRRTPRW